MHEPVSAGNSTMQSPDEAEPLRYYNPDGQERQQEEGLCQA